MHHDLIFYAIVLMLLIAFVVATIHKHNTMNALLDEIQFLRGKIDSLLQNIRDK